MRKPLIESRTILLLEYTIYMDFYREIASSNAIFTYNKSIHRILLLNQEKNLLGMNHESILFVHVKHALS